MPRLAARLSDEAPGIRMIIRPADYRSLGGRLDSGDADLALSATPTKLDPRHRHKSLYKEPFVALYDRSQLNSAGDLDIATYVETPHLFRSLSGDLRGQVDAALAAIGKERSVAMALSSFSAAPFLLRTQASLINIPAVAAYFFAKEFDLELSRLPIDVDSFPVSIIWHARSGEDPFHQWFRKLVSETCFELAVEAGVR
ncbi:MAG: LysR substrate-binding domain-containing protein [Pseudomonadota bacterium]